MVINWNEPKFGEKELELVRKVLESGYVSEGPMTKELEKRLSVIVGCKHIIMTTSCTAALWLAIEADKRIRNYTKGEVIIPDLTFVGTKNAVEMAGLKPMMVDVDYDTFCLGNIEINKKTQIVMPVNLLGKSKGYSYEHAGIICICDNAGCLGSDVPIGKVGCYSLQGNKLISCGQGGFCATDDDKYAEKIRQLKDFGREDKFDNNTIGFNLKFNDILAAVTLGQLELLDDRRKLLINQYTYYKRNLKNYGTFMKYELGQVPLWVEFKCKKRNELFKYLEKFDIKCRKPWNAITGLPNAIDYEENVIWLPNGPTLVLDYEIRHIVDKIKEFYDGTN